MSFRLTSENLTQPTLIRYCKLAFEKQNEYTNTLGECLQGNHSGVLIDGQFDTVRKDFQFCSKCAHFSFDGYEGLKSYYLMKRDDHRDLEAVLDYLRFDAFEEAYSRWGRLDTNVRDSLPRAGYIYMTSEGTVEERLKAVRKGFEDGLGC